MRTAETCIYEATNYVAEGKFEKAIECYVEAIKLDPHHINAHVDLGNTYIKANQFDKAI